MEEWQWAIGTLELKVRWGDLLKAPERAWVNSEQTDFYLARNSTTISGQIRRLWPQAQAELDLQTQGSSFPAGKVLKTSGPEGRTIFHAGFHEPQDWYNGEDDKVPG